MSENKKIILIQPNAALLERAESLLKQAGWEIAAFDDVKNTFDALNKEFDALVLGVGIQWFDAVALLKAVSGMNPGAKAVAWLEEPMEKVEDLLKDAGIGVVYDADALTGALEALTPGADATKVTPGTGITGYLLIKATDGATAPMVFNALRNECDALFALKDDAWHMAAEVSGPDADAVNAKLDALAKTEGIENTEKLINTAAISALDAALLNARKQTIKTISFAFGLVKFMDDSQDAATLLALCPGITAVAVDKNKALVQLAGVSLAMIQEAVSRGIYALPTVLGVELFAGLNILEVE